MAKSAAVRRGLGVVAFLLWFSLPVFPQVRTTPVEVKNEPVIRIDPTSNTVKAQQDGTWSVGIAPSANTVSEQPRYDVRRLWSETTTVPAGWTCPSSMVFLEGYREVRVLLMTTASLSNPSDLWVWIRLYPFGTSGDYINVGYVTFGQPAEPFVKGAVNYNQQNNVCMFSFPVWAKAAVFLIQNKTGNAVQMSENCYVYLTN
ncbi:MAG: hypothetical protein QHI38_06605 [Armatimonadota bacterium]|nr:hypothetical protein [Armatimonadota bacterium]